MPTYDYVCDACGHEFELFQSMTDSVKRTCPKCKNEKRHVTMSIWEGPPENVKKHTKIVTKCQQCSKNVILGPPTHPKKKKIHV